MQSNNSDNCTALASLDFKEVIERINTGSEDFWGVASNEWLVFFYAQYIALIILFIIVICWCVLVLLDLWKRRWLRTNCLSLYVVFVYCTLWSTTSALQYILLAVDVSLMPSQDLAVVTYCLEMVAFAISMNGILIYAVNQYYQLKTPFGIATPAPPPALQRLSKVSIKPAQYEISTTLHWTIFNNTRYYYNNNLDL